MRIRDVFRRSGVMAVGSETNISWASDPDPILLQPTRIRNPAGMNLGGMNSAGMNPGGMKYAIYSLWVESVS